MDAFRKPWGFVIKPGKSDTQPLYGRPTRVNGMYLTGGYNGEERRNGPDGRCTIYLEDICPELMGPCHNETPPGQ